jgi:AcrR family transcriptional regulator
MPDEVKRPYDAGRRQALARESRARVLDAARRQFLAAGYAATTLARIAAEAGVSVPSINKSFGNKAGLLRALFDVAIVGDDEPVPLAQRNWITAIHAEPDARRKLQMYASVLAEMLPRTAPIQLLIRQASDDPSIAEVWQGITTGRLMGMTDLATNLAAGGYLREGITLEQARDVLWIYSSPELYELLVIKRAWTTAQYAAFIETGAAAALLPA